MRKDIYIIYTYIYALECDMDSDKQSSFKTFMIDHIKLHD